MICKHQTGNRPDQDALGSLCTAFTPSPPSSCDHHHHNHSSCAHHHHNHSSCDHHHHNHSSCAHHHHNHSSCDHYHQNHSSCSKDKQGVAQTLGDHHHHAPSEVLIAGRFPCTLLVCTGACVPSLRPALPPRTTAPPRSSSPAPS